MSYKRSICACTVTWSVFPMHCLRAKCHILFHEQTQMCVQSTYAGHRRHSSHIYMAQFYRQWHNSIYKGMQLQGCNSIYMRLQECNSIGNATILYTGCAKEQANSEERKALHVCIYMYIMYAYCVVDIYIYIYIMHIVWTRVYIIYIYIYTHICCYMCTQDVPLIF